MIRDYQTVADVGEFRLIDRIQKLLPKAMHKDLMIGIGDDAAVIRLDDHRAMVVTCDIQVENQHFRLSHISPYQLGRRAMAVNLSDIAAMGAQPNFALVSLGFPKSFPLADFDALFKGMQDQLANFSASIIGGNLSNTEKDLIIDITLMGEVATDRMLTREGARPGDRIFVTGKLGESGAGFYVLEKYGQGFPAEFTSFVEKHRQPIPRIEAGKQIAESGFATAMIDISDGIASDLWHICERSHAGAEIQQEKFPVPEGIHKVASISGKSVLDLTLHSGEDYELLFTLINETPDAIVHSLTQNLGVAMTEIGSMTTKASGYHLIDLTGRRIPIQPSGWDHFIP